MQKLPVIKVTLKYLQVVIFSTGLAQLFSILNEYKTNKFSMNLITINKINTYPVKVYTICILIRFFTVSNYECAIFNVTHTIFMRNLLKFSL